MATLTRPLSGQERSIAANVLLRPQRSLWMDAWHRLIRNRGAMAGLAIIVLACLVALLAPVLAPYDPIKQDTPNQLSEPFFANSPYVNPNYLLGTDTLGRDTLSRLIWAARISIVVGFVPAALVFFIGIVVGMVAGYYGGWIDNVLMRITDIVYGFPDLLFLIIIMSTLRATAFGEILGGLILMFVAIAVVAWIGVARLTRGQVLALKEKEFIEAARSIGVGSGRIMLRHLFPNALAPLIVAAAFSVPGYILLEAGLSFLGIGIKPPTPTWGVMISEGFVVFSATPWPVLLPALCISIVMLSFTFVGDGLRDALDPRMKI